MAVIVIHTPVATVRPSESENLTNTETQPNAPTVSVCLPTYNYAEFVGQAIESVLAQTYRDFELLVYDDASTDDSAAVIEPFTADPRVTFVKHDVNQGLFANFNQSAEAARGKYIKYLCADDWLGPDFLEKTVKQLEANEQLVMSTTANWLVDGDGELTGSQTAAFGPAGVVTKQRAARTLARWGNAIGMPSNTLIRREQLLAVGIFDPAFAPAADVQLWLKLLERGELGWLPEKLCSIRVHNRHSHSYGPDPTESSLKVWEAARELADPPFDPATVALGLEWEAQRNLLYVFAHLFGLRPQRARAIWQLTARHVKIASALAQFAAQLPRTVHDQFSRVSALRSGKMVDYGPRPRAGEKLETARARLRGAETVV